MYTAFKQLENGEFARVASRDELEEAVQLVESLNEEWPGGYEVRESRPQMVRYATNFRRSRAESGICGLSSFPRCPSAISHKGIEGGLAQVSAQKQTS
jgi:hypothetical protein